jgi:aldose 1-epimerase
MSPPDASFTPSGEQIEIRHGDQRVVIVEVGGGLRSYIAAGHELLDGYDSGERCTGGRGQVLIPWPNRLRDGWYEFAGRRNQLALSEPPRHNAIHGLVRWVNWTVADRADDRVVMALVLHPQAGWPFALDLRIEYTLGDDGLTVTTTATNVGADRCPYGAGAHPYLRLGTETIDALVLHAPGRRYLRTDDQGIPIRSEVVQDTPFDFLSPRELGATELDTGYCDLTRDPDGRARVRLATSDGARRVSLWLDHVYPYLMLFTGDSLPETDRRRRGLGVEPMTCAPNALQSGDGLRVLEPGESLTGRWGISPS